MSSALRVRLAVERLETREVPATLVNPTTVTYQDIDGDDVTVKFSKAILNAGNVNSVFKFNTGMVDGSNASKQQLRKIDLSGQPAAGTAVAVTAKRNATHGGDGFVNLGELFADGIDLGPVSIRGDVGRVRAGDGGAQAPALVSLTVQSIGRFSTSTGAPDLYSEIFGRLGALNVKSDVKDARFEVKGGADGKIGSIMIGGSIVGGSDQGAGRVFATGAIGPVTVRGDIVGGSQLATGTLKSLGNLASLSVGGSVRGGAGQNSGVIEVDGQTGSAMITGDILGGPGANSGQLFVLMGAGTIQVGGSVLGGAGNDSGSIFGIAKIAGLTIRGSVRGDGISSGRIKSLDLGSVTVFGDLQGGAGATSGQIIADHSIGSLTINGSIRGLGSYTGLIHAQNEIAKLTIGGNVIGGSAGGNDLLIDSGFISASRIGNLTLGGSLVAGVDQTNGIFLNNGAIRASHDIGSVLVKGSLMGNDTNFAVISAVGSANVPPGKVDVAIGSLRVLGCVEHAQIWGGFDEMDNNVNADARIGSVTVGGDWIASTMIAGVKFPNFSGKDDPAVQSKIASITIGGQAIGSPTLFGPFLIAANEVGSLRIGGTVIPLTVGAANDDFWIGITNNFKLQEVA